MIYPAALDRQLEIRIDKRESIRHVFVKGSKELSHLDGEIEAYQDIRGLIKDFPSLVKEEVEV
jgi:hypothetical protein